MHASKRTGLWLICYKVFLYDSLKIGFHPARCQVICMTVGSHQGDCYVFLTEALQRRRYEADPVHYCQKREQCCQGQPFCFWHEKLCIFSFFCIYCHLVSTEPNSHFVKFSVNKIDKFWEIVSAGKTGRIICKKESVKKG